MPGILSIESADGRTFDKSLLFVALYRPDGTKTLLSSVPEIRASSLGFKSLISFLDERKNTLFAIVEKSGAWKIIAATDFFRAPVVVLSLKTTPKDKGSILAFSRSESGHAITLARSTGELDHWEDYGVILKARKGAFDTTDLSPVHTELTKKGILIVYTAKDVTGRLGIGAALFDREQPGVLLWRSEYSLWQTTWEMPADTKVIGGANTGKYFSLYTQSQERGIESYPIARYWEAYRKTLLPAATLPPRIKGIRIPLERYQANPVLEPIGRHAWEAFATFNPAALCLDDQVHLLYRAQGYDGLSVLGYAASSDGIHIDERQADPAFVPSRVQHVKAGAKHDDTSAYLSGSSSGGCEDPRLVEIEGIVYLVYIAFDGVNPPGVALSYISKSDFVAKRWRWARPRLISRPGQIQKNWVLFPEKINGKYAIIHGISPQIKIEYLDNLQELGNGNYIDSLISHGGRGYIEPERLLAWDNIVRGVGAPPLKTPEGWVVFYHGMDMRDPGKYKVGVMLLDLEHPEIILRRALEPVLEPETAYENGGHKPGVIYVCGAIIKGSKIFVYYGAGDRTTGVAMTDLATFMGDLMKNQPPTLSKMKLKKIE
ncbi:MAG: hypothetical protein WAT81_05765 [Candidatus Moraniibacteriota bacterium]